MHILIGYEKSGMVREALRRLGHDAWSCDLQAADDGSPCHIQADIREVAGKRWDMGIFHPMCTYLTVSAAWAYSDGPYHQKVKSGTLVGAARREAREKAIENFRWLDALPYPTVIENPARSFITKAHRGPDQIIHPYQFGDDASKATGLWMSPEFSPLETEPALYVVPRMVGRLPRWANQTDSGQNNLTPNGDRWNQRSRTYPGIAAALAEQLPEQLLAPPQMRLAV